jgi:hypothetical protein
MDWFHRKSIRAQESLFRGTSFRLEREEGHGYATGPTRVQQSLGRSGMLRLVQGEYHANSEIEQVRSGAFGLLCSLRRSRS